MPPPSGATAPPTAVVADDERLMRDQLIGRLKEAWPDLEIVGEATNGSEAVALVQREEPDIVFLDISMPGMDGIQAARAVAGQAHVVFVTAYDQYAISAFETGAVDYLLKPPEPERVTMTCERLKARLAKKPDPMSDLLARLSERLARGGHVHVLDLVLPERAGPARLLARWDRGDHPRPLEEWRTLLEAQFEPVVFEPYALPGRGPVLWEMVYFKGRRRP